MRRALGFALPLAFSACLVGPTELAGKACDVDADCGGALVCRAPRQGEPSVCVPEGFGSIPGGVDGGNPPVPGSGPYWCGDIENILKTNCAGCHGSPASGGAPSTFRLDVYASEGGVPGARDKALRVQARMVESKSMPPPSSAQPTDAERARITAWIAAGAPECVGSEGPGPLDGGTGNSVGWDGGSVSFATHVQPLFDAYCITCHTGKEAEGDLMLTAGASFSELTLRGDCDRDLMRVVPGASQSSLLWMALSNHGSSCAPAMPLGTPGLKATAPEDFKVIEAWITQGAKNN